ncbi:MAG TPA: adenylosuccinate lyase [Planctomycetota bacterium]|nr:adenylosuccinate lyase [Planctomycetota bacterium]
MTKGAKGAGDEAAAEPGADPGSLWRSALASRYTSRAMQELFSERRRAKLWREIWIALAETQRELGLDLPAADIAALARRIDDIDLARAAELEKTLRHDVMAHLHAFAELHPPAKPFLHLGATSCTITDNADLIVLREALVLLRGATAQVMQQLADFARQHRALPTLGYTHFQPAQPTTVGKRACLWLQDLLLDFEELERLIAWLPLRGVKGTTGTQASFLSLFGGDHAKVRELDRRFAARLGFATTFAVTGQTYPRKVDARILSVLSGLGQSAAKAGNDLRLLAHEQEIEEPFEEKQVGSSAMAYKRNPMRAERMVSLARFLIHLPANAAETAAQQWLERTLDDSANRRIVLAEACLAADAVLRVYQSIFRGILVHEPRIRAHLERELPFMATEEILMQAVQAGGDRQDLHEKLRVHARAAAERMKGGAADNDLFARLSQDPAFAAVKRGFAKLADGSTLTGRAAQQVVEFLTEQVEPALKRVAGAARREIEDLKV